MSRQDEKANYLHKKRDFSSPDDGARGSRDIQHKKGRVDGVSVNQEARDGLLVLKAVEKQRINNLKERYVESLFSERVDRCERQDLERNSGPSGSKRPLEKDNFGSFFGKVEKVVTKRVVDEERAREIAARKARIVEAERAANARADSRNEFLKLVCNGSGIKPAAKSKPTRPVSVKAQKLKDSRDYSFLFWDGSPRKPVRANDRDSRAELSKASLNGRCSAVDLMNQKSMVTLARRSIAASNVASQPASDQALKASIRFTRYDDGKSAERNMALRRVGHATKSELDERPPSREVLPRLLVSSVRSKNDEQLMVKSVGPNATNHESAVLRDSWSMEQPSVTRAMEASGQSGNRNIRERKQNDNEDRRRDIGAPTRRPVSDEATRRKPRRNECTKKKSHDELRMRRLSEVPTRSKPAVAKEKQRPRKPEFDHESSSNDGGGVLSLRVSSIIQNLFCYNTNMYKDLDDLDDKNMEMSFRHIQAEEKRSKRPAREEDGLEQELIEEEEWQMRVWRRKKQKSQ